MATILMAEDETNLRDIVVKVLTLEGGHRVVETSTGTDTLEALRLYPIDLLLLDVMLPGLDGYSLQLKIFQNEALKDLPVVVYSAMESMESMFLKFPQVKAFLPKTTNPFRIAETVNKILGAPAAVR